MAQDELNQDAEEALEGHSKKAGGGRKQRQDDGEDEDDAKVGRRRLCLPWGIRAFS